MNRKYIDFVPKNSGTHEPTVGAVQGVILPSAREEIRTMPDPAKMTMRQMDITKAKAKKLPRMSVMRSVGRKKAEPEAKDAPDTRTRERSKTAMETPELGVVEVSDKDKAMKSALGTAGNLDKKLRIPKANFVNIEKVAKRPLSKNVYQKPVVTPKEEPQGPVTIIAKPERDSKMGLVITIIVTIILGAAAGTVAFLLLPK